MPAGQMEICMRDGVEGYLACPSTTVSDLLTWRTTLPSISHCRASSCQLNCRQHMTVVR